MRDWRSTTLAPLVGMILLTAMACSATTSDFETCSDNSQCRAAFGIGSICGVDGLCELANPIARCDVAEPEPVDLLTNYESHHDTIVLGSLQDRSLATKRGREKSARLAIRQANRSGGLDGRLFGMVFCTVEIDPTFDNLDGDEAASAAANYLVDVVGVPAIVGPSSSARTQTVFLEVKNRSVLVMSPSASSTVLTTLESTTPGLLWRTAPPDSLQAAAIVEDMTARGISNVHVVHETGAYGEGLAIEFSDRFVAGSGTVSSSLFSDATQRDLAVDAAGANAEAQEVLFAAQTVDMVALNDRAVLDSNFAAKTFFVTDTAANDDFLTVASDVRFSDMRGSSPAPVDSSDPNYRTFLQAYLAEYSEDAGAFSFTAHAYDAAWLVLYGVAWSQLQEGGVTGPRIAAGLRQISDAAGTAIGIRQTTWQNVVEVFRAGDTIDVAGASGALDYDPATEETSGPVEVWTIGSPPGYDLMCEGIWTEADGLSSCP